jgi:hypothetical protein
VAFDLKVFFSFIDKTPVRVTSSDVMSFITVHRNGDGGKVVSIDRSVGGVVASHGPAAVVVGFGVLRVSDGPRRHVGDTQPGATRVGDSSSTFRSWSSSTVGAHAGDIAEGVVTVRCRSAGGGVANGA